MKICYIGDAESIHLQRWIKWFADKGHEIHLITSSAHPEMNVTTHLIGDEMRRGKFLNFIRKMIQTKKLVREINPDILHAHYVFGSGTSGAYSGFHPFIISPLGSDITIDSYNFIKRLFIKYALKRADIISMVEGSIKKRLIELKCDPERIKPLRISNVDTKKFHPSRKDFAFRDILTDNNDFLVMNARSIRPIYHIELLIRAIPYVIEKIPSVKFLLVSFNPDYTYENQIIELIRELRIEDKVRIIFSIPHLKMPDYLASIDLYVDTINSFRHAESGEKCPGIGTTTLEAMSCGTPVLIANENPKNKGKCPFVPYHPMNPEDLARQIVNLLRNEELRNSVKERALAYACEVGDENKVMRKWEIAYYELNFIMTKGDKEIE